MYFKVMCNRSVIELSKFIFIFRIVLEPPNKKFKKGTVETFNIEAIDVGPLKKLEVILRVVCQAGLSLV